MRVKCDIYSTTMKKIVFHDSLTNFDYHRIIISINKEKSIEGEQRIDDVNELEKLYKLFVTLLISSRKVNIHQRKVEKILFPNYHRIFYIFLHKFI